MIVNQGNPTLRMCRGLALLALLSLSTACRGPVVSPDGGTSPSVDDRAPEAAEAPVEEAPTDFDPYFSDVGTAVSPQGPGSITRHVLQDRQGDIWLATWEGIIRYDGRTFTNYTLQEGLRKYRSFCILEDRNGVLWFGTIGAGLYRVEPDRAAPGSYRFTNLTTRDGLVGDAVQCIFEDRDGKLWFGTQTGLSSYDGKTFQNYTEADGMPDVDLNSIVQDASGTLWIGARGEACTFDGRQFQRLTRASQAEPQPFVNVRSLMVDSFGSIWLTGNDGLWRTAGAGFEQLDSRFGGYLYQAPGGDVWLAQSSPQAQYEMGLYRYTRQGLGMPAPTAEEVAMPGGQVFGIIEDDKGHIWFGTVRGVMRYDGKSFQNFRK